MTTTERPVEPQPARIGKDQRQLPSWRWEELRTTFWVVPRVLDTTSPEQRTVLQRQADMVLRLAEETVSEPNDLEEIRLRHDRIPGEQAFERQSSESR